MSGDEKIRVSSSNIGTLCSRWTSKFFERAAHYNNDYIVTSKLKNLSFSAEI